VACFPAIFLRLLDFVAIYGLVLMPIGAVVFVEHWLFPVLGLRAYWAQSRNLRVNPAALASWVLVLVLSFPIRFPAGVCAARWTWRPSLFFRWRPVFNAAASYLVLAPLFGAPRENLPVATPRRSRCVRSFDSPTARRQGPLVGHAVPRLAPPGVSSRRCGWLARAHAPPTPRRARFKTLYMVAPMVYFAAALGWSLPGQESGRVRGVIRDPA